MRDYAKVAPTFWTGETGKKLRAAGKDAQLLGLYLMTNPHANMIGIYYLPKMYIAHETGMTFEGASEALARCSEGGFCTYDEGSEVVYVHEMARYQIADQLDEKDNRCKGIANELSKVPQSPLIARFLRDYSDAFHLGAMKGLARGFKAPPKPRTGTGARTGAGEDAESAVAASPAVVSLPLADGSEFSVTEKHVAEWKPAYPRVDVVQELREMRVWCLNNPAKRKKRAGVLKFANGWLSRSNDEAKGSQPASAYEAPALTSGGWQ